MYAIRSYYESPALAAYCGVALAVGFAMMAIQTTLNRIGALAFGASHFTFAMVVAVFVLCIAIGSLAVSALPRIPAWIIVASQWLLVLLLLVLYFWIQNATYYAHALRMVFRGESITRITSYNVCYTKLLRLRQFASGHRAPGDRPRCRRLPVQIG